MLFIKNQTYLIVIFTQTHNNYIIQYETISILATNLHQEERQLLKLRTIRKGLSQLHPCVSGEAERMKDVKE